MPASTEKLRRLVAAGIERRNAGARALRERIARRREDKALEPARRIRSTRVAPFLMRRGWGW